MQKLEDLTHKKEKQLESLQEQLQKEAEKNALSPTKTNAGKLIEQNGDKSDSDDDKREIKNSSDDDGNKKNLSGTYLGN